MAVGGVAADGVGMAADVAGGVAGAGLDAVTQAAGVLGPLGLPIMAVAQGAKIAGQVVGQAGMPNLGAAY